MTLKLFDSELQMYLEKHYLRCSYEKNSNYLHQFLYLHIILYVQIKINLDDYIYY